LMMLLTAVKPAFARESSSRGTGFDNEPEREWIRESVRHSEDG
jgi:hypothetical protein